MHIEVSPVPFDEIASKEKGESSEVIRERVMKARDIQLERFKDQPSLHANAMMPSRLVREYCQLDIPGKDLLKTAMKKLDLSARAYDRILKVSRTIADLAGSPKVEASHVAEAIQYRSLDRESWKG